VAVTLLWAAPTAIAEEGGGDDLEKKIKAKMERILELMKKNEEALLELSTGSAAETKRVDVPVPPAEGTEGPAGNQGSSGADGKGEGKSTGAEAEKALRELAEGQRKEGGTIPGELRELVELIPL
jgi:hypothetical protein